VESDPVLEGEPAQFGVTPFPILGSMPAIDSSAKTPFRPDSPCEEQEPPDLRSSVGPAPPQSTASSADPAKAAEPISGLATELRSIFDPSRVDGAPRREVGREMLGEYGRFLDREYPRYQRQIKALGGGE
jgi:hypothetical protein